MRGRGHPRLTPSCATAQTFSGTADIELKMAAQIIGNVTGALKSDDYSDKSFDAYLALVRSRSKRARPPR